MYNIYRSYNTQRTPHIGYLFSIVGFAIIFGIVTTVLLAPILNMVITDVTYNLFITQIITAIMTMLLPVWLTEQYYRRKQYTYLYRAKISDLDTKSLLYSIMILLAITPIVSASIFIMEQIPIPTLIRDHMTELNALIEDTYDLFLLEHRPLGIILSIISIIIVAPIAEEYLFRGAIQGWILANTKSVHVAVWISALLFSLIHMQWGGFLARFLLGAILGYSAIYGSIWMAIFIHFLNNLFTFLSAQILNKNELIGTPDTAGEYVQLFILFICSLGIIFFVLRKMKKENTMVYNKLKKDYEHEN